jgi:hypothetical protein
MDSLVALRFKINELKMLDFLEKKKRNKCLLLEQFQEIFRKMSICKKKLFWLSKSSKSQKLAFL